MKQSVFIATSQTIQSQSLKDLLLLWEARRKDDALPSRHAFSFQDFRPWLGVLCIMKYNPDTHDMVADLVGTVIAEWDKKDLTKKALKDDTLGEGAKMLKAPLHYAINSGKPTIAIAYSEKIGGTLSRLVLPCSDNNKTIDRLIVALEPDPVFRSYLHMHSLLKAMLQ